MIEKGSKRHRFGVWLVGYSTTFIGKTRHRWWLPMRLVRWVEFRMFLALYHIGLCISFGFKNSLKAVAQDHD